MGGRLKAEQRQRDAEALLAAKMNSRGVPIAREGVIVDGSWRAADASVEVIFADTYAALMDDPGITPLNHPRVPLWTTHLEDTFAPVGGERVHLVPTQSGYAAILQRNADPDMPAVPSGERWIQHRNANGQIDAYIRWTNDGPSAGDGLGSLTALAGALLSVMTAGGLKIVARDDSGLVGIGDDPANLDATKNAAVTHDDLKSFAANIQTWAQNNFASNASGSGWTGAAPDVPDCSQTVLIKD